MFNPKDLIYEFLQFTVTRMEKERKLSREIKSPKTELKRQIPVPTLAQTFTANFQLTFNSTYYPPYTPVVYKGKLAFDFPNFGAYFMVTEIDGNMPFSLQTGWIVSPQRAGADLIVVNPEGNGWSLFSLPWLLTDLVPPFSIPPDAQFYGDGVVNGHQCTIWNYYFGQRSITIWVRESDGALIQGYSFGDPLWTRRNGIILLSNIQLSVDPALYQRPKNTVDTMTWSHDSRSHLPWYWCDPFC